MHAQVESVFPKRKEVAMEWAPWGVRVSVSVMLGVGVVVRFGFGFGFWGYLVRLLIPEDIKVVVDVLQAQHGVLNRNWLHVEALCSCACARVRVCGRVCVRVPSTATGCMLKLCVHACVCVCLREPACMHIYTPRMFPNTQVHTRTRARAGVRVPFV